MHQNKQKDECHFRICKTWSEQTNLINLKYRKKSFHRKQHSYKHKRKTMILFGCVNQNLSDKNLRTKL